MSVQPPRPDDPLAVIAKATAQSVQSADAARAEKIAASDETTGQRKRFLRAGLVIVLVAIVVISTIMLVRTIGDPNRGVDPFADPAQAKAYVTALLDSVMEWSSRHGGRLPYALDEVVPQGRLLPDGSAYRLEYRVEEGVPVVALQGGREPIVVRGANK